MHKRLVNGHIGNCQRAVWLLDHLVSDILSFNYDSPTSFVSRSEEVSSGIKGDGRTDQFQHTDIAFRVANG